MSKSCFRMHDKNYWQKQVQILFPFWQNSKFLLCHFYLVLANTGTIILNIWKFDIWFLVRFVREVEGLTYSRKPYLYGVVIQYKGGLLLKITEILLFSPESGQETIYLKLAVRGFLLRLTPGSEPRSDLFEKILFIVLFNWKNLLFMTRFRN